MRASPHEIVGHHIVLVGIVFVRLLALYVEQHHPPRIALLDLHRRIPGHDLVASVIADDSQAASAQLVADQVVDRDPLDLLGVDEIVVVVAFQLGQARPFDKLLDLRGLGLLLGFSCCWRFNSWSRASFSALACSAAWRWESSLSTWFLCSRRCCFCFCLVACLACFSLTSPAFSNWSRNDMLIRQRLARVARPVGCGIIFQPTGVQPALAGV